MALTLRGGGKSIWIYLHNNKSEFREKHSFAVKRAMEFVDKEKLAYENRSKNVQLTCVICGEQEMVYTTQQKYCSKCKAKYTRWELSCLDKSH